MVLGRWPPATSNLFSWSPNVQAQINTGMSHVPQGMRTPATLGPADDQTLLQQPPHFNTKLYGSTTDLLGSRLCPRHLPSIVSCIRSSPRTAKQKGTQRTYHYTKALRNHRVYFSARAARSSRISFASDDSESCLCRLPH